MSMTTDMLHELFYYEDGKLMNRVDRGRNRMALAGEEAGGWDAKGYRKVKVNGKWYKSHRLIYMLHFGHIPNKLVIDHIDRDPSNNRIENLRAVTQSENCLNSDLHKHNWKGSK